MATEENALPEEEFSYPPAEFPQAPTWGTPSLPVPPPAPEPTYNVALPPESEPAPPAYGPAPAYGQVPPPAPYAPAYPQPGQSEKTDPLALASVIVAVPGLFCCAPLGPVAIILAIVALTQKSAQPKAPSTAPLAITGLVMGALGSFILVISVLSSLMG